METIDLKKYFPSYLNYKRKFLSIDTFTYEYVGKKRQSTGIQLLDDVITCVLEGYRQERSVAKHLNIPVHRLQSVLKTLCNVFYKDLYDYWHLQKVDMLVRYSSKSLKEVAKECGYNSANAMSRWYIAHAEIPPSYVRYNRDSFNIGLYVHSLSEVEMVQKKTITAMYQPTETAGKK